MACAIDETWKQAPKIPIRESVSYPSADTIPITVDGYRAKGNTILFGLGFLPTTEDPLMVINNTSKVFIDGEFSNLEQGQVVALKYGKQYYVYYANYYGGDGNDLVLAKKSTLSVSSMGNGKTLGGGEYIPGNVVNITAMPDSGYRFAGWQGSVTSQESSLSIRANKSMTLSAVFEPDMSDPDGDGISNYRELTIYHTDPNNPDTDGDGISDLFEVCARSEGSGTSESPSIGSDVTYNFNLPELSGKLKFLGKLPTGLSYDPDSGYLSGQLTGKPGVYVIKAQLKDESGAVKTLSLSYTISPFPVAYVGTYQMMITLDQLSQPHVGFMELTVLESGAWTAELISSTWAGSRKLKGFTTLGDGGRSASIVANLDKKSANYGYFYLNLKPDSSLVSGGMIWDYAVSTIKGFRLAKPGELELPNTTLNFAFTSSAQESGNNPGGDGWATGKLNPSTGTISLSGQLGDAQPFKATIKVSATGQAILWTRPYGSSYRSFFGGFLNLRDVVGGEKSEILNEDSIRWYTELRRSSKSYPMGFGPITATAIVSPYAAPLTADALALSLGLGTRQMQCYYDTEDFFLSVLSPLVMPQTMSLADNFSLVPGTSSGQGLVPWNGKVDRKDGTFFGSFDLGSAMKGSYVKRGKAVTSGILMQKGRYDATVGYGLIQIPIEGTKGVFVTVPVEFSDSE